MKDNSWKIIESVFVILMLVWLGIITYSNHRHNIALKNIAVHYGGQAYNNIQTKNMELLFYDGQDKKFFKIDAVLRNGNVGISFYAPELGKFQNTGELLKSFQRYKVFLRDKK